MGTHSTEPVCMSPVCDNDVVSSKPAITGWVWLILMHKPMLQIVPFVFVVLKLVKLVRMCLKVASNRVIVTTAQ